MSLWSCTPIASLQFLQCDVILKLFYYRRFCFLLYFHFQQIIDKIRLNSGPRLSKLFTFALWAPRGGRHSENGGSAVV